MQISFVLILIGKITMDKSQYIKIQNFRCFKELEVKGFKRVNLIGGKNNAGKTSLLEALLLYFHPNSQSIIELRKIRKESFEVIKKDPQNAWDNFFYNKDIWSIINIHGYFGCFGEQSVKIWESKKFDNSQSFIATLNIEQVENEERVAISRLTTSHKALKSSFSDTKFVPSSFFAISSDGKRIAQQYDKIRYDGDGKSEEVLKILKILDPSITGLETYSFIEPTLYIQTQTQPRGLPISLFGDAIYRVTAIILELLDKENKVLFIDEIENGIHYTNQQNFWEGLFTLAERLDTLIFATTHSLEMIKAFTETGKYFPEQGTYFELAYSPRTDKIVAINRDIDLLEYDLEHGKAIRGE